MAADLWRAAGLPPAALAQLQLPGAEPVLRSSFALATALQASLGVAALAAATLGQARGGPLQQVRVTAADVVAEASAVFRLEGVVPPVWDPLSGLYRAADGWLRVHANFAHHRDGVLRLLGLQRLPQQPVGETIDGGGPHDVQGRAGGRVGQGAPGADRAAVAAALAGWRALDFEQAAAEAGLVVAAARNLAQWDAHAQAAAVAALPLLALSRHGDAAAPPWPPLAAGARPLQGLRVLDLTRILAGPVAGRTLAAYGAEVMLVNAPQLPNIAAIADTSRGKLSVQLDLKTAAGRDTLRALLRDADVLLQAYRPGALAALGFGPDELQRLRPGLVQASLSAYGDQGPWGGRRGFDSLVQTATGLNAAEALAFGGAEPRAFPLQVLDYSAGYLLAFGIQAALWRRAHEGGGWRLQVSLARCAQWLRGLGRCRGFETVAGPDALARLQAYPSGFGRLEAVPHAAQLSATPAGWDRPSMPPGSHAPAWPALISPNA